MSAILKAFFCVFWSVGKGSFGQTGFLTAVPQVDTEKISMDLGLLIQFVYNTHE